MTIPHEHDHPHEHGDSHEHLHTETITLEQKVLAKNDRVADENRRWLAERDILALNMTSSPGAGKTTLLERTIRDLGEQQPIAVIEGDQETLLDADRIRAAGARAVQINTGGPAAISTPTWCGGPSTRSIPSRARCCSSRTSATSSVRPCSTSASTARSS